MSDPLAGYYADYFAAVARQALDDLLAEHGFKYVGDHRNVTLYWSDGSHFFRVGYLPETTPRYELLLGVGEEEDVVPAPKSAHNSVGVWRLLPPDIAPQIVDWRFDSPQQLERELRRAWTEAIVPYVLPALEEEGCVRRVIAEQSGEARAERERLMDGRLLRFARQQFDARQFARAVQAYDELPADALTAADRKRREIAQRRM